MSRSKGAEAPSPGTSRLGLPCDPGEPGLLPRRVDGPPGRRRGVRGMRPVDLVLDRLESVRQGGEGYQALCPVHDDREPSLSVAEGEDGRALLKCFAGCGTDEVVTALGLQMKDLFEQRNGHGGGEANASQETTSTDQPATLENYAAYVGLPVEHLEALSLEQYYRLGKPAVRIPYLDEAGEEALLVRSRVSLTGKPKILTRKGDKHRLYGLWKLEEAREAGYAVLVEGESDAQTLWFHGLPGVGIPGANGWNAEWAPELEGIDNLYFVIEDEAGEKCWRKLAETQEIRDRLYRVELEGVKDVCELHKRDPDRFEERLREALEAAEAWEDLSESESRKRAREARA